MRDSNLLSGVGLCALVAALSGVLSGCGEETKAPIGEPSEAIAPPGEEGPIEADPMEEPAAQAATPPSCSYINAFSNAAECKTYVGEAWTSDSARRDCDGLSDSTYSSESCDSESVLGTCHLDGNSPQATDVVFPGDAPEQCSLTATACEQFAGGEFEAAPVCADVEVTTPPPPASGTVFIPPEQICAAPVDDVEGMSADGEVCTWESIGGCTEPGRQFGDYAACEPVMTQRPYFPMPPSSFETDVNDPIREDPTFLTELAWVKDQAESCGCVCCHTTGVAPRGAAAFDTAAPGIWTDTFTERGLAIAAGWVDSSALGAHGAASNNGFDRSRTGLPTTDIERMVRFFEGELERRGATREQYEGTTPTGGPLVAQMTYEPSTCVNGEGVDSQGGINWVGGAARYIYVLEAGSDNPGVPPNLDRPAGTVWRLDVDPTTAPLDSGVLFGEIPEGARQSIPESGVVGPLRSGETYYLYVLADVGAPVTRCTFEYTEAEEEQSTEGLSWGVSCTDDTECAGSTDYCVKMPGDAEGYCSTHCDSLSACADGGAPGDWTCNAVNCSVSILTWCGPASEIAESGGFLSVCP